VTNELADCAGTSDVASPAIESIVVASSKAFNEDSLQRGICFANFTPLCKPLRRQGGSGLAVNLALGD
jgi:hypothetical protein